MSEWEMVVQGGVADLGRLADWDYLIDEGEQFQLVLQTRTPVSASVAQGIKSQMVARSIPDADVSVSGNTMRVTARKGFPWLAVILAIILAAIVLVIILVSWSIFKRVVPAGLQGMVGTLVIVGLALLLLSGSASRTREGAK